MGDANCGGGCSCENCGGCVRGKFGCIIFPSPSKGPGGAPNLLAALNPPEKKLALSEVVTLSVSDLTLVDVALFMGSILRDPIAIPADKAYTKVKLKATNKSLLEIVEKLGLLRMPRKRT
jgi:hypothetical protein